jgi:glycosyltransferase 2 family protein
MGVVLLGIIVHETDLAEAWTLLVATGATGVLAILSVYFAAFAAQTLSWHLTLQSGRRGWKWFSSLWNVLVAGEALNSVTPGASVGGEPLKVALMKKSHGISYRETTSSLMLQVTVQNLGLIPFVVIGICFMLAMDGVPASYALATGATLAVFSAGIAAFFLVQRHKVFTRAATWLGRGRWGERARSLLDMVHEFEDRLIAFYRGQPRRFAVVVVLEFATWVITAAEVLVALYFLDFPVSWAAAWMITAVVCLVRATLFFVPGNVGTQEVGFVVMGGMVIGSPEAGLALALIIRFREILWVIWGLVLGWILLAAPGAVAVTAAAHVAPELRKRAEL